MIVSIFTFSHLLIKSIMINQSNNQVSTTAEIKNNIVTNSDISECLIAIVRLSAGIPSQN